MSLRWRLTLVIGGVVAIMLLSASFLAYFSADRELNRQVDEFLVTRARETEQGLAVAANLPLVSAEAEGFQAGTVGALRRADASIQLVDPQGPRAYLISGSRLPVTNDDLQIALGESSVATTFDREIGGTTYRVLVSPNPQGALMIGRSIEDVSQTLEGLRGWLIVITISGSLAAAFVGWLVADRVLRPVSRLAAATQQVAETTQFDADLRVDGKDELGRLAQSFNSMLSALRASRAQQERLVRDANHELRTPLTSLRTNVDVLRRQYEALSGDERLGILNEMDGEVRELTSLVTELVTSATESGTLSRDAFVTVDLVALAEGTAERARRRTGRVVTVTPPPEPVNMLGDGAALDRALGNLIGNAVKFSPAGEPIEICVQPGAVTVCDRGPGIPEEEHGRIFDRFYRSDATRTMPGSGLGLAIVSEIATAHGGKPFVTNRDDELGGACVGFEFGTGLPNNVGLPDTV